MIAKRTLLLPAVLVLAVLLAGCSEPANDDAPTGIVVSVEGGREPSVEQADLVPMQLDSLADLTKVSGLVFGSPVEISLDGDQPTSGATLTRTYAAPIPDDAVANFMYWDPEFEVWIAVPSTLSPDRRTVIAQVDHFSVWTDIVAGSSSAVKSVIDAAKSAGQTASKGAGEALTTGSEALHWSLANIFTTRVELPECYGATPTWVFELPVGVGVDDPIRFCAGRDQNNPDLLVLKARANRGYGFPVILDALPAWEYNSTDENNLSTVIGTVGSVDATIGESIAQLVNNGRFVGAGEEISFGIPESAARGSTAAYILELPAPTIPQYLASTLSEVVVSYGASQVDGTLAATIAIASCLSATTGASDVGKGAGAVLTCLSSADETIARILGEVLRSRGMQEKAAGKLAGSLVGRVSVALAVLPTLISVFDYTQDVLFPPAVRALTIILNSPSGGPDDRWLIDSTGIGPLKIGSLNDEATYIATVGAEHALCIPESGDSPWSVGSGGFPTVTSVFVLGQASNSTPQTKTGITIGSKSARLQEVGAVSSPWSEVGYTLWKWTESDRQITAWVSDEDTVIGIGVGDVEFFHDYC